jgi:hypothetical protein
VKIGVDPLKFWDYTLAEINIMYEEYVEKQKENSICMAAAVREAIVSAYNGKPIRLYEDNEKPEDNKIDRKTKIEELNSLKEIFS